MTELPDNSVHLAITSPPYWQLKDYGTDNQIGFHDSYENYTNNLKLNRNSVGFKINSKFMSIINQI